MVIIIVEVVDCGVIHSIVNGGVLFQNDRVRTVPRRGAIRRQVQVFGDTLGVRLAQLLQLGITGEEVGDIAGVGQEGVFHDDTADAGLFAAADDAVIVCQASVGIRSAVFGVLNLDTPVLQPQVHQLIQDGLSQLFAVGAQIGPIVLVGIVDLGTVGGGSGTVQMKGDKIVGSHTLGIGNPLGVAVGGTAGAVGAAVGGPGQVDSDTVILLQSCLAVLGNLQGQFMLIVLNAVDAAAGAPVGGIMIRVQHDHHIAGFAVTQRHGGNAVLQIGVVQSVFHRVRQHLVAAVVQGGHVKDHVGLFAAGGGFGILFHHYGVGIGLNCGIHTIGGVNADVGKCHLCFHTAVGVSDGFYRICTALAVRVGNLEQSCAGRQLRGIVLHGFAGGLIAQGDDGLLHSDRFVSNAH